MLWKRRGKIIAGLALAQVVIVACYQMTLKGSAAPAGPMPASSDLTKGAPPAEPASTRPAFPPLAGLTTAVEPPEAETVKLPAPPMPQEPAGGTVPVANSQPAPNTAASEPKAPLLPFRVPPPPPGPTALDHGPDVSVPPVGPPPTPANVQPPLPTVPIPPIAKDEAKLIQGMLEKLGSPEAKTPSAPSPAPVGCPWVLRVEIVQGRTQLSAETAKGVQFRLSCERLNMQAPQGSIEAKGTVKLSGSDIEGTCDRLTITWQDDQIVLEGQAHLTSHRDGLDHVLQADRMSLRLSAANMVRSSPAEEESEPPLANSRPLSRMNRTKQPVQKD